MCFESRDAAYAAVCQERDDLRQIVEKQAAMNQKAAELALELDSVKAERDALKAADLLPVTREELRHLINDTIAYIWKLEDRGAAKPEYGYDSRKALLEKLKQFEKEHFPELGCCGG